MTNTEQAIPSRPDAIAVDLEYRDLAIAHLTRIDPGGDEPGGVPGAKDDRLQLGVITLPAVARTAAVIRQMYPEPSPVARRPLESDLDVVLDGLRRDIGRDNGGWYPRMGKLRSADVVGGLPHIGAGWEYPTAVSMPPGQPFLKPATGGAGRGQVVGMIDGKLFDNSELNGRWDDELANGQSGLSTASTYPFLSGHAAFVAGRILERAPGARLAVRGLLGGAGVPRTTIWELATAMADATEPAPAGKGLKVLNLSLGCYTEDGDAPFVLERAVDVLRGRGVVVVAAAGNHADGIAIQGVGPKSPIFPAACAGAVAVGAHKALDTTYRRAPFSPSAPWISIGAPGADVRSTYLNGTVTFEQLPGLSTPSGNGPFSGYAEWSGTSFAAATVSGEIARLMAATGKSAFAVVDFLRTQDPNTSGGIGRYLM